MAWIDLPGDEATKELARTTLNWRKRGLAVPSILSIMKPSPKVLRAVSQMNDAVTFGGSTLGQRKEELIATSVSILNDCFY